MHIHSKTGRTQPSIRKDNTMPNDSWFNRIVEYWVMPQGDELVEHIRRAKLQVVQIGNFGPLLYGLADDHDIERWAAGVPLYGLRENLDLAAIQIARCKEAGARVVGQLSMSWHYGDPEQSRGLFGTWDKIWTREFLGSEAPCTEAAMTQQLADDGTMRRIEIAGRPYVTCCGCYCNPHWLATLKAMVAKGVALGLDGFNVHHNYEKLCGCAYCQAYLRPHVGARFTAEELKSLFDTIDLDQLNVLTPRPTCPDSLQQAFALTVEKAANRRRKEAFDELFTDSRRHNPDFLLAQWYHKYDFRPHDERSLLPPELWAKDESYIWYSQGPWQRASSIGQGYLADMGLPGRFMYAAGGGRPYVINKYDYRRWRIWCGEAITYGGSAIAYHAGPPRLDQEDSANIAPEDFYGPVVRYQRFMAAQEKFLHPAKPHVQIGLVYPRRAEREAEMDCLDALKRLGRHLEDGHLLFDIIIDDQLLTCGGDYPLIILPEVKRLSREEETFLRQYVEGGGKLLFTGGTASMDLDGTCWPETLLPDWRSDPAANTLCGHAESHQVHYLPTGPWIPVEEPIATLDDAERPVYPPLDRDPFGQQFIAELKALLGESTLRTDAPWYVRTHAWRPEQVDALVLHWINYRQNEESAVEVPIPTGPIQVDCVVPDGWTVDRIEWLYPEMREGIELEYRWQNGRVHFEIPTLIVYGMGVVYLHAAD